MRRASICGCPTSRCHPTSGLGDAGDVLLKLLASPNIASKRHVYRQYDHQVQTNTVIGPGAGDAAVLRVKGTGKAIAVAIDGNGRQCFPGSISWGRSAWWLR